jgi:hypothetical protein
MTSRNEHAPDDRQALYLPDRELHRRIAPHLGWDRFCAALKECERDPLFPRSRNYGVVAISRQ